MAASSRSTTVGESAFELRQLHSRSPPTDVNDGQVTRQEFSLPPVDTGKDAWLFLAACWVVEAVTFGTYYPFLRSLKHHNLTGNKIGFGMSFGVFQNYYSQNAPFAGSGNIAAIGTTTMVRYSQAEFSCSVLTRELGPAVHRHTVRLSGLPYVPKTCALVYTTGPFHLCPRSRHKLLLQNSTPAHRYPRHLIRPWRLHCLLPLYSVY